MSYHLGVPLQRTGVSKRLYHFRWNHLVDPDWGFKPPTLWSSQSPMFEEKLKLAEKKIFRHSKAAHSKPAAQEVGRVFFRNHYIPIRSHWFTIVVNPLSIFIPFFAKEAAIKTRPPIDLWSFQPVLVDAWRWRGRGVHQSSASAPS